MEMLGKFAFIKHLKFLMVKSVIIAELKDKQPRNICSMLKGVNFLNL